MKENLALKHATVQTNNLLEQYKDYMKVSENLDKLKSKQMTAAIRISTEIEQSFAAVLQSQTREIIDFNRQIDNTAAELQQISDDMTFINPVVWIMYKYKAYMGTSQAILDMQDFRSHCSKPGYICTNRFLFLNGYLSTKEIDLTSIQQYPNEMSLEELYSSPQLLKLLDDSIFMGNWGKFEYYTVDGRVAKWENCIF